MKLKNRMALAIVLIFSLLGWFGWVVIFTIMLFTDGIVIIRINATVRNEWFPEAIFVWIIFICLIIYSVSIIRKKENNNN